MASFSGSTESEPTILIVGSSLQRIEGITNALKSFYFKNCVAVNDDDNESNTSAMFKKFTADIITKYYTASVNVWALIKSPGEILKEHIPDSCEAIISINDSLVVTKDYFEGNTKKWIDLCKHRVGSKIFALTYVDQEEIINADYIDVLSNWAFDNKVEYVKINMNQLEQGKTKREKEGIARVYECLETTMWPNMKRLNQGKRNNINNSNSKDESTAAQTIKQGAQQQEAPLPESVHNNHKKKGGKVVEDVIPVVITNEEMIKAEQEVNNDSKMINETEELMSLIAKAKDIREASLNGSMTDAQRYEQAEKTAMRLAELFDLMGGDELNELVG